MSDDWDKVTVIRKKIPTGNSAAAVSAAKRQGVAVGLEKKFAAGANKNVKGDVNAAKLDGDLDGRSVETINAAVSKVIMKARQEKGLTQKDLAVKINEKATIINEYEAGKAVPNQQVLGKLERILGVKLRGSNIGEKIEPRGSKK